MKAWYYQIDAETCANVLRQQRLELHLFDLLRTTAIGR